MFRPRNELPVEGELPGLDGSGTADYQRMYQLIRQPQPIDDRSFEIEFADGGVEAFVFTFG